jgi:hypothetical protein
MEIQNSKKLGHIFRSAYNMAFIGSLDYAKNGNLLNAGLYSVIVQ